MWWRSVGSPCVSLYELSLEWPCCLILLVCLECRQAGLCSAGWYFQRLPQSCHTAALCSKTVPLFTRPNSLPFRHVLTLWIMLFLSLLVLISDRLMHVHCSFSWYACHFLEPYEIKQQAQSLAFVLDLNKQWKIACDILPSVYFCKIIKLSLIVGKKTLLKN